MTLSGIREYAYRLATGDQVIAKEDFIMYGSPVRKGDILTRNRHTTDMLFFVNRAKALGYHGITPDKFVLSLDYIEPYDKDNFVLMADYKELPKNNDGRSVCAFCFGDIPTRKAGNGRYDICTKCGK